MVADILVGLLLGGLTVAVLNPWKGAYFMWREMKQQIQFLRDGNSERGAEFPNRKEDS